jgi:acyl carrier protein
MGLSRQEIFEVLREALIREFELPADLIRPEAHVVDDLDLDSIDAIDLAVCLEEELGVSFGKQDLAGVRTLQDVVDLIDERL